MPRRLSGTGNLLQGEGALPPFFMKFLSLFRTKSPSEIEVFAKSLVSDLVKRYPPELDNSANKHPSVNRLTRILEDTCRSAADFQSTHKLGVYGKAKLGNNFKWSLSEAGYRKEFIDLATEAVVVYLSKKSI